MERRLAIAPWTVPANENNDLLRRGGAKLGIATAAIRRNVSGCANLGYCGMGCPTNAKQSMLVTTIPAALDRGARLLVQTRVERLEISGDRVQSLVCRPVQQDGATTPAAATLIRARHVVVAGGAIGSPALMPRSDAPDPHGVLGRRTTLAFVLAWLLLQSGARTPARRIALGVALPVAVELLLTTLPLA